MSLTATYRFKDGHDLSETINSLRVAAGVFAGYAKDVALPRIAEQFQRQADTAERIADELAEMEG